MGVPSWVYSDLPEEQKMRLFQREIKHRLWAVIAGIVLAVCFILIAKIYGWK